MNTSQQRLWGVGRPKKACRQCTSQKLRCSGDRPACTRCSRLQHSCKYDASSTRRSSDRPQTSRKATTSPAIYSRRSPSAVSARDNGLTGRSVVGTANISPRPTNSRSFGIPQTLVSTLIDTYFANVYNATLLLHEPSFRKSIADGTVRDHVLLSVCAWAANFYRDKNGVNNLKDNGFMLEWADQASRLVFHEVENPYEDNIVTFVNLSLLFYSQGNWRRSIVHKGNALLLARMFGLSNETPGKEDLWESEVRRRRFWACHLVESHSSESLSVSDPSDSLSKLTLPWIEEDYELQTTSQDRTTLDSACSNGGLYCELIKAMSIWSSVNTLVKTKETNLGSRITAIHELNDRIDRWWAGLPVCLHLTPDSVPSVTGETLPKLLLIHIAYHQSLAALHASIVPLFSWSPGGDTWLAARQLSAQIAFEHACSISYLLEAVLANFSRLSAIPSFVAYAAYCSYAIQVPFSWCSDPLLRTKIHQNVKVNAKIIKTLSQFWRFASVLEICVQYLHEIHAKTPVSLESEPKHLNPRSLTGYNFDAVNARETILSFNRILWKRSGGYAKSDEELLDLSINIEGSSAASSTDVRSNGRPLLSTSLNHPPDQEQGPNHLDDARHGSEFASSFGASNGGLHQRVSFDEPEELMNLDFFRLMDPNMLTLEYDAFDISQLDTSLSFNPFERNL